MRQVKQKHKNGCAIAALAMLTGIGYQKVCKKIHPKLKPRQVLVGTTLEQALRYLFKLKIKHKINFSKIDLRRLKNNAYLSVNTKCGNRHAMVWNANEKKLIDPQGVRSHYMTLGYIKKHLNFIIEILD